MNDAALVVTLANARAPRRPTHARHAVAHDALADLAHANLLLKPFLDTPLGPQDLAPVSALQSTVVSIVDALIEGDTAPLEPLNELASRHKVIYALERDAGQRLRTAVRPDRAARVATLLVAVIRELSELEPSRLRRCARQECRLVFYDISRSGTQRWHAERPCGLRERQRRHRDRPTK